jgi:hypothetical protein
MTDQELSFEEILDELMLEEPAPTYEALQRWQALYPKYRFSLARFFATWAIQRDMPSELQVNEERITGECVMQATEIARQQGRLVPPDHIEVVQQFDQGMLAAIYVLHGQGDAADIADKVTEMSGNKVSLGAALMSLTRLEEKGLITSWKADRQKCFTITIVGERALAYAKETSRVVSGLLGDMA